MCLLHHCYGGVLDNRSAPYSGDVIAPHNSVSNGGVTKCERRIQQIPQREYSLYFL